MQSIGQEIAEIADVELLEERGAPGDGAAEQRELEHVAAERERHEMRRLELDALIVVVERRGQQRELAREVRVHAARR
jgi:hypothetical protein